MSAVFPFEADCAEIEADPDRFVDAIFSCLESEFLVMPRGKGFVWYADFEKGYEELKRATASFQEVNGEALLTAICETPISFIVLRTMLGFTPPEWAYAATERTGVEVTQGAVRTIDRNIRMAPLASIKYAGVTRERLRALVSAACLLLAEGAPEVPDTLLHRLDKADTKNGLESVRALASMGAPYAMLLYERYLGRPFAAHRDSVSEIVGDRLESAIEGVLNDAGISYRKTKRAERIEGFDQAPDFIVPSEFNPQVVMEAKIAEDDGTARDKVTRIQHLRELSLAGQPPGQPKYEVIGCIAGRGFKVRREDIKKMLLATRGKLFTLKNLDRLVECTKLAEYRSK